MPDVNPTVIITDRLIELEPEIFGVDEMPDANIKAHARAAADHVIKTAIDQTLEPSSSCCQE
jgi:hypothetical protein